HQFLSPYFNKRTDGYGGSVENRCRFLLEIVAAARAGAGLDVAISVKWSVQDSLPDGWDVPQSLQLVRMLRAADVDALGASSGVHGGQFPAAPPYFYPMGTFLPFVDQVRGAASMPLYTSGRLDDPELCEKLLRERRLDFVQVCRGLIADPDWVRKIAEGRVESIRPCLACNHCRDELVRRRPIRCSVNAACGRERDEDAGTTAAVAKSVLVVGGGPAGLETARIAARRGHRVTLFERTRKLGGMLAVGGVHNPRIEDFRRWLVADVESQGVDLRLGTEVTPEQVEALAPEHVVLATGGAPARLEVPGSERDNVYSLSDFLGLMRDGVLRKGALMRLAAPLARRLLTPALLRRMLAAPFPLRSPLVIIGGQFAGCSLALLLAHLGRQLTLIESSASWGTTLESNTRVGLDREVSVGRVRVLTSAQVVEIVAAGVVVSIAGAEQRMVEAATVIVALDPERGDGELGRALAARGNVRTVGDAGGFGRIPNAIAEGHAAAHAVA
ncbi:MAG: FAD-dependent oxidoreductase, partial [Burkholderiales bacterium]|nr:FAD-dependent oxidoreductase [Burkholderiales bacterium]